MLLRRGIIVRDRRSNTEWFKFEVGVGALYVSKHIPTGGQAREYEVQGRRAVKGLRER